MNGFIKDSVSHFSNIGIIGTKKHKDELAEKFIEIFLIARTIENLARRFEKCETRKEVYILFLMMQNNIEMFEDAVYSFTYNKIIEDLKIDLAKNIRIDIGYLSHAVIQKYIEFIKNVYIIKSA